MNILIVGNLRQHFEIKFNRRTSLTDEQVWECFNDGYFCEDAEEAYMEFMFDSEQQLQW